MNSQLKLKEQKARTHNREVQGLDIHGRVIVTNRAPSPVHHLHSEELPFKDISQGAIRSILDSSFNKAGMVRAIYVKINNGVVFEVKPYVRLPRTCKRFCGIMVDFLQKARVCSGDGNEALLRVIEEPVTRHLPSNSRIIGLSYGSEKLVNLKNYVSALNDDLNLVFVLGPMNCGDIKMDYVDEFISVSPYSMRVNVCLGTVCLSFSFQEVVDIDDYVSSASDDTTLVYVVGAMAHGKIDQDYTDEFISICKAPLSANACLMKICVALEESRDIFCFN
ncbi:hypothetical protein J5N97_028560 [Dioscorea zingiberensis]|uniref:Ribosomal RNA small subunit methyltransferase NEP1 n=1 Tax=Dioscorea zingiberensis TaxID=325984 RepID=A0A9D5H4X8_9LILI|nr:hypothetical protein J5N97_028560 [Dioscorea zingiberensis]